MTDYELHALGLFETAEIRDGYGQAEDRAWLFSMVGLDHHRDASAIAFMNAYYLRMYSASAVAI